MRRLGTLASTEAAERFAAALRHDGITADLRPEPDGSVEIWVHDEDRLGDARAELAAFQADPKAERFRQRPSARPNVGSIDASHTEAGSVAASSGESAEPSRRERRALSPSRRRLPATLILIGISTIVSLITWTGKDIGEAVGRDLSIASYRPVLVEGRPGVTWDGLAEVESGQVWRLVTPIFPHGGPLHLLFNMAWLWLLGGAVEAMRGPFRCLAAVLVIAVASNLAEYWFDFGFTFDMENGLRSQTAYRPSPMFFGMSGVVFGLFGFVWMRARLLPRSGFAMPRDTVVWMLIWLLVCTSGLVGPIANVAHGIGLLTGMLLGAAPRLWRRR